MRDWRVEVFQEEEKRKKGRKNSSSRSTNNRIIMLKNGVKSKVLKRKRKEGKKTQLAPPRKRTLNGGVRVRVHRHSAALYPFTFKKTHLPSA